MEWLADPSAWMGLLTLIVLELVLGIDNLVFIAILADKLPPHQRDKARLIGLSLALIMRLALLGAISWMVTLTRPLFEVFGHGFSGRDLIMLLGGLFLLTKATVELHDRLEGAGHERHRGTRVYAGFGAVLVQIVVLDAVFSLDSVITAVGMVDHLSIMMIAVIIAIGAMMIASKPLTAFVTAHPTLIVLCLGLLLMIGFSLVAEGLGFHIPKGYLYVAIGFAILIETLNQVASANRRKRERHRPLRERTADAVLRLLGGREEGDHYDDYDHGMDAQPALAAAGAGSGGAVPDLALAFQPSERSMIKGVLNLAERQVTEIMTPRPEVDWIDLADPRETIRQELAASPFSRVVVVREGNIDEPLGIVQKKDLLSAMLSGDKPDPQTYLLQPPVLPEFATVLAALERFKREPIQIAFVVDEFGSLLGVVSVTDVMEAIAGELPEEHEPVAENMARLPDGSWSVEGRTPLDELAQRLRLELEDDPDYHTTAGLLLDVMGKVPDSGEEVLFQGWWFRVEAMDGNRIERIHVRPEGDAGDGAGPPGTGGGDLAA
ncbi:MAG: TerC family protein [Xanthomonadales bacterium]|nr:TerC family protein [Xanthomonadales bacterium]